MTYETYFVDAFADRMGSGNPAAVVFVDREDEGSDTGIYQRIASEMGKSETAFVFRRDGGYSIRWFAPNKEMPLCGHATLAAAKVLFENEPALGSIAFAYRGGIIDVERGEGGAISMAFPLDTYTRIPIESVYREFFGIGEFADCIRGGRTGKVVLVVDPSLDLTAIKPDFRKMKSCSGVYSLGIGISKRATERDFETRYFNPWAGVDEDPVTGSVHTLLARYWRDILGKDELVALQNSQRPGTLSLSVRGDGVIVSGQGCVVLRGRVFV